MSAPKLLITDADFATANNPTTNTFAVGSSSQIVSTDDEAAPNAFIKSDGSWQLSGLNGVPGAGPGTYMTYTPVLTGLTTDPDLGSTGSLVGEYTLIGDFCDFTVTATFGGSGISAGSGRYNVTLPVAAHSSWVSHPVGTGDIKDASASATYTRGVFLSSTTVAQMNSEAAAPVGSATPITPASGDTYVWSGRFRVATSVTLASPPPGSSIATLVDDMRDLSDATFKTNIDNEIALVAAGAALGVYNIADPAFGASPANTAAANSVAIQAAADAAYAAGKGIVYIPDGTFSYDTTISVLGIGGGIVGSHRRAAKLTYTGSGTAITFKDRATATQKLFPVFREFTLTAASATTAIDAIGSSYGVYESLEIVGEASPTVPTSGTVGILLDGSLGASIGCWHNVVDKCYISGWDADVKMTGVAGSGQANENRVLNTRLAWHNTGVWVDVGDHCTVQGCDISTGNTGAIGVHVNDVIGRVLDNRFEQVATAVKLGANSDQAAVRNNSLYNGSGNIAIRIESGAKRSRHLGDNAFSSTVTKFSVASTTLDATGANLNYFSDGQLVPLVFQKTAVAASLTNSALDIDITGNFRHLGRPYQIRGVSARFNSTITAGTATVTPTIGGTGSTTLSASATSGKTLNSFQPMSLDTNSGTSSIGCVVTTSGTFAAAGAGQDLTVVVWVEFTGN